MKKVDNVIAKSHKATKALIKILLAIGIISLLIGAISIPTQYLMFRTYANEPDKRDYYGNYYAYTGTEIITIKLLENNICVFIINGDSTEEVLEFNYRYLPASKSRLSTLSILPSIEIYQKIYGLEFRVFTLKVFSKNPYIFMLLEAPVFFTQEELTFEKVMQDPKDYYGDYVCGDKSIGIRKTGDFFFREYRNEEIYKTTIYTHEYRNKSWVKIKFPGMKKCEGALIIDNEKNSSYKVVFIIDENTLIFENQIYHKEQKK